MSLVSMFTVVYHIDDQDRLVDFNEGWTAFALANNGQSLLPAQIRGRPLLTFLADASTKHLYQTMIDRVRHGGPPIHFRFRCDSEDRRRLLAMDISAIGDACVRFCVTSAREIVRPSVSLFHAVAPAGHTAFLTMCSWCKRVQIAPNDWIEAEIAVHRLALFGGDAVPGITHGICPPCHATLAGALTDPHAEGSGSVTVGALPEG